LNMGMLLPAELAEAWGAATGLDVDADEWMLAGERGYQVQRAFNALRGVDRSKDGFVRRPEPDSWAHGIDLDHPGMLDEYYRFRGCTPLGLPLRSRLEEVGLRSVANDLEQAGRLGEPSAADPIRTALEQIHPQVSPPNLVGKRIVSVVNDVLSHPRVSGFLNDAQVTELLDHATEMRRHVRQGSTLRHIREMMRTRKARRREQQS
jgi:hypothetical protein